MYKNVTPKNLKTKCIITQGCIMYCVVQGLLHLFRKTLFLTSLLLLAIVVITLRQYVGFDLVQYDAYSRQVFTSSTRSKNLPRICIILYYTLSPSE